MRQHSLVARRAHNPKVGGSYTTILAEGVIIQLVDSVQVKEKTENNNEVSEIR